MNRDRGTRTSDERAPSDHHSLPGLSDPRPRHRVRAELLPIVFACAALLAAGPSHANDHITVSATADQIADDGQCTLREATQLISTGSPTGSLPGECVFVSGPPHELGNDIVVVEFDLPAGSSIAADAFPYVFDSSVEVRGPGSNLLTLAAGGVNRVLVFDGLDEPLKFLLFGVTVRSGTAFADHRGYFDRLGGGLAAILPDVLYVRDVAFVNNLAEFAGGGAAVEMRDGGLGVFSDCAFEDNRAYAWNGMGGGAGALQIVNAATMEIHRCLFADNEVLNPGATNGNDADGGALQIGALAAGTLLVTNTTFSGNSADGEGGAIVFGSTFAPTGPNVATTFRSVTVVDNQADSDGDAATPSGGGMHATYTTAMVSLRSSIFADNRDGGSVPPAPNLRADSTDVISEGWNWISIRSGATDVFDVGAPNASQDWVGTLLAPLDPLLGPLEHNGGRFRSILPLDTADGVVDRGHCEAAGIAAVADQRNWWNPSTGNRTWGPTCDIGAVELGLVEPLALFVDGFESGTTSAWSDIEP